MRTYTSFEEVGIVWPINWDDVRKLATLTEDAGTHIRKKDQIYYHKENGYIFLRYRFMLEILRHLDEGYPNSDALQKAMDRMKSIGNLYWQHEPKLIERVKLFFYTRQFTFEQALEYLKKGTFARLMSVCDSPPTLDLAIQCELITLQHDVETHLDDFRSLLSNIDRCINSFP
jgi:hypothetical protein